LSTQSGPSAGPPQRIQVNKPKNTPIVPTTSTIQPKILPKPPQSTLKPQRSSIQQPKQIESKPQRAQTNQKIGISATLPKIPNSALPQSLLKSPLSPRSPQARRRASKFIESVTDKSLGKSIYNLNPQNASKSQHQPLITTKKLPTPRKGSLSRATSRLTTLNPTHSTNTTNTRQTSSATTNPISTQLGTNTRSRTTTGANSNRLTNGINGGGVGRGIGNVGGLAPNRSTTSALRSKPIQQTTNTRQTTATVAGHYKHDDYNQHGLEDVRFQNYLDQDKRLNDELFLQRHQQQCLNEYTTYIDKFTLCQRILEDLTKYTQQWSPTTLVSKYIEFGKEIRLVLEQTPKMLYINRDTSHLRKFSLFFAQVSNLLKLEIEKMYQLNVMYSSEFDRSVMYAFLAVILNDIVPLLFDVNFIPLDVIIDTNLQFTSPRTITNNIHQMHQSRLTMHRIHNNYGLNDSGCEEKDGVKEESITLVFYNQIDFIRVVVPSLLLFFDDVKHHTYDFIQNILTFIVKSTSTFNFSNHISVSSAITPSKLINRQIMPTLFITLIHFIVDYQPHIIYNLQEYKNYAHTPNDPFPSKLKPFFQQNISLTSLLYPLTQSMHFILKNCPVEYFSSLFTQESKYTPPQQHKELLSHASVPFSPSKPLILSTSTNSIHPSNLTSTLTLNGFITKISMLLAVQQDFVRLCKQQLNEIVNKTFRLNKDYSLYEDNWIFSPGIAQIVIDRLDSLLSGFEFSGIDCVGTLDDKFGPKMRAIFNADPGLNTSSLSYFDTNHQNPLDSMKRAIMECNKALFKHLGFQPPLVGKESVGNGVGVGLKHGEPYFGGNNHNHHNNSSNNSHKSQSTNKHDFFSPQKNNKTNDWGMCLFSPEKDDNSFHTADNHHGYSYNNYDKTTHVPGYNSQNNQICNNLTNFGLPTKSIFDTENDNEVGPLIFSPDRPIHHSKAANHRHQPYQQNTPDNHPQHSQNRPQTGTPNKTVSKIPPIHSKPITKLNLDQKKTFDEAKNSLYFNLRKIPLHPLQITPADIITIQSQLGEVRDWVENIKNNKNTPQEKLELLSSFIFTSFTDPNPISTVPTRTPQQHRRHGYIEPEREDGLVLNDTSFVLGRDTSVRYPVLLQNEAKHTFPQKSEPNFQNETINQHPEDPIEPGHPLYYPQEVINSITSALDSLYNSIPLSPTHLTRLFTAIATHSPEYQDLMDIGADAVNGDGEQSFGLDGTTHFNGTRATTARLGNNARSTFYSRPDNLIASGQNNNSHFNPNQHNKSSYLTDEEFSFYQKDPQFQKVSNELSMHLPVPKPTVPLELYPLTNLISSMLTNQPPIHGDEYQKKLKETLKSDILPHLNLLAYHTIPIKSNSGEAHLNNGKPTRQYSLIGQSARTLLALIDPSQLAKLRGSPNTISHEHKQVVTQQLGHGNQTVGPDYSFDRFGQHGNGTHSQAQQQQRQQQRQQQQQASQFAANPYNQPAQPNPYRQPIQPNSYIQPVQQSVYGQPGQVPLSHPKQVVGAQNNASGTDQGNKHNNTVAGMKNNHPTSFFSDGFGPNDSLFAPDVGEIQNNNFHNVTKNINHFDEKKQNKNDNNSFLAPPPVVTNSLRLQPINLNSIFGLSHKPARITPDSNVDSIRPTPAPTQPRHNHLQPNQTNPNAHNSVLSKPTTKQTTEISTHFMPVHTKLNKPQNQFTTSKPPVSNFTSAPNLGKPATTSSVSVIKQPVSKMLGGSKPGLEKNVSVPPSAQVHTKGTITKPISTISMGKPVSIQVGNERLNKPVGLKTPNLTNPKSAQKNPTTTKPILSRLNTTSHQHNTTRAVIKPNVKTQHEEVHKQVPPIDGQEGETGADYHNGPFERHHLSRAKFVTTPTLREQHVFVGCVRENQ
jgi:hypothetical protein